MIFDTISDPNANAPDRRFHGFHPKTPLFAKLRLKARQAQ